jgi:molybdopterin converting factor small subunit
MAIEVRIPTILRTYTGGEKAVDASGTTLAALIDDLETNHPGIRERLLEANADGGSDLRRFVNVYVNDEDVRFTGGLETALSDGDQVVVLPAVAGGSRLGSTTMDARSTTMDARSTTMDARSTTMDARSTTMDARSR